MKAAGVLLATAALTCATLPATADRPSYNYFSSKGKQPGAYWNPCEAIGYGIDFTYAKRVGLRPKREVRRWRSAVAAFSEASGLRFRYVGSVKTRSNGMTPEGGPPLVIVFGGTKSKGRYGYGKTLRGQVAGVGGVQWLERGRKPHEIVSGYVVIDAKALRGRTGRVDRRPPDQRPPDPVRALYMHEFGHAVGLDHVEDRRQLMYPVLDPQRPDAFGKGERRALAKMGRQSCF